MSIYVKDGVQGQIRTTSLPSGDMAVSSPTSGPLEQIVFNLCRWSGRKNISHGGWIVPAAKAGIVRAALNQHCKKISD